MRLPDSNSEQYIQMTPDAVRHKNYNHLLLSEQMPASKNTINSSNRHAKDGNQNSHNLDHITETANDKSVGTSIVMHRIRSGSDHGGREAVSPSFRSSMRGEGFGISGGGGASSDMLAISMMRSSTNNNENSRA